MLLVISAFMLLPFHASLRVCVYVCLNNGPESNEIKVNTVPQFSNEPLHN